MEQLNHSRQILVADHHGHSVVLVIFTLIQLVGIVGACSLPASPELPNRAVAILAFGRPRTRFLMDDLLIMSSQVTGKSLKFVDFLIVV